MECNFWQQLKEGQPLGRPIVLASLFCMADDIPGHSFPKSSQTDEPSRGNNHQHAMATAHDVLGRLCKQFGSQLDVYRRRRYDALEHAQVAS